MSNSDKNEVSQDLQKLYMGKYDNPNPIAKWLTDGFFRDIGKVLATMPEEYRLLEVGCGPGESTRRILGMLNGQYLEASEFEQEFVDFHRQQGFPVTISQESVYEMHRKDDEFDCVMLLEVMEHLDDFEAAIEEVFRVASKSVLVSVPREPLWHCLNFLRGKYWSDWGNTPGHINHWSRRGFMELIARHGNIISVYSPVPWTIIHAEVRNTVGTKPEKATS